MEQVLSIEPEEFLKKLNDGDLKDAKLIDVREDFEWNYYHLEGIELMPMNTIPARLSELPRDKDLYVVCAHGVRSWNVCNYLKRHGFDQVINVEGGMAALAYYNGFQYD